MLKMMSRLGINRYMPGVEDDEVFISNIAVYEQYRGKGISTKLLNCAQEFAKENGYPKLSLYTEIDNFNAIKVYEKYGFKTDYTVKLPKNYHKHDCCYY